MCDQMCSIFATLQLLFKFYLQFKINIMSTLGMLLSFDSVDSIVSDVLINVLLSAC